MRRFCLALLALAALTLTATAQDWPTRPVTMVVPFAAGGITDVIGRALGQRQSARDRKHLAEIDGLHRDGRFMLCGDRNEALVPEVHERRNGCEIVVDDLVHVPSVGVFAGPWRCPRFRA